jgi:hypothetical protein
MKHRVHLQTVNSATNKVDALVAISFADANSVTQGTFFPLAALIRIAVRGLKEISAPKSAV